MPYYDWDYLIRKNGSNWEAIDADTDLVLSGSNNVDAAATMNACMAAKASAQLVFKQSAQPMIVRTPISVPLSGGGKQYWFNGNKTYQRVAGTVYQVHSSFPDHRFVFECLGVGGTNNMMGLYIDNAYFYNPNAHNFGSGPDVGSIQYESDRFISQGFAVSNVIGQYMWRGVHMIGNVIAPRLDNVSFRDDNQNFVGDIDFIFEPNNRDNPPVTPHIDRPVFGDFRNISSYHATPAPYSLMNRAFDIQSKYCNFFFPWVEGTKFDDCMYRIGPEAWSNTFWNPYSIDYNGTTGNTAAGVVFDMIDNADPAVGNHGNVMYGGQFSTPTAKPTILFRKSGTSGAWRNYIQLRPFGAPVVIDGTGAGIENVIEFMPGHMASNVAEGAYTTFTQGVNPISIVDNRLKRMNKGTGTLIKGSSTVVVTHGLFGIVPYWVDIRVTSYLGPARFLQISATSTTTFTVAVNSAFHEDITFEWRAYAFG